VTEDEMRAHNPSCKWPEACGRTLLCAEWHRNLAGCVPAQGAAVLVVPTFPILKSPTKSGVQ